MYRVHFLGMKVKVAQLCPTLCDPVDYAVHGILQARKLECVAFPFSRGSSQPRDRTQVPHFAGGFFTNWASSLFHNFSITGHFLGSAVWGGRDSAPQRPLSGSDVLLGGPKLPNTIDSSDEWFSFMKIMKTLGFIFFFPVYFHRSYGINFDEWHKDGIEPQHFSPKIFTYCPRIICPLSILSQLIMNFRM